MRTIAAHGLSGVTMKTIAVEAGISPRLIAYYYDDLDQLIEAAHQMATERFYGARQRVLEADKEATPTEKLVRLITSGLPGEGDLLLSQVLDEVWVNAARSPMHATLGTLLFDREVSLYASVLQEGAASGHFTLADSTQAVARTFVLLEDALGTHLLGNNTSVSALVARQQLASYARVAAGVELRELTETPEPALGIGSDHRTTSIAP